MANLPDDEALAKWAAQQPERITSDPLWRLAAYRHASFCLALARHDSRLLAAEPRLVEIAAQLLSAAGSVAANIGEGYGRPTAADRIRYLTYALGSVRECATWYEACADALGEATLDDRATRLSRTRRILFGLLKRLRRNGGRASESW